MKFRRTAAAVAALALVTTACGGSDGSETGGGAATDLSGEVVAAGSSTVLPVAEYVLEIYRGHAPDVDASYTSIGSGGGFERLCELGDVDVSGASRAIKESEAKACTDNGIEVIELQFGVDALTMVTSPQTDYVECIDNEQLVKIFGPDGVASWDAVIDGAPSDPIDIYAPDTDSGTYGFMVEDVMDLDNSRQDYSASADDNVIVQGIQSGAGTWGFFGLAYFQANQDGLKAIAYDQGDGNCVLPSAETAADGTYGIVRPLYIYVRVDALRTKPQVADFVQFFLDNANEAIDFVGYVSADDALTNSRAAVAEARA